MLSKKKGVEMKRCILLALIFINISYAQKINIIGHYAEGMSYDVYVQNGYLYTTSGCLVKLYDIRDTAVISKLDWNTPPIGVVNAGYLVKGVEVQGDYLYIASEKDFVIVDVSDPHNPNVVGDWPWQPHYPWYGSYEDVKVHGDYAYLSGDGPEYLLIILDISDPSNPVECGHWGPGYLAWGSKLDVSGNYAYVGEDKNLHIVDISDPTHPTAVGTWTMPEGSVSSIAVRDTIVFAVEYHWGLWAIDVSDPINPVVLDSIRGDHDPNANDVKLLGDYAYLSTRYEGFRVIDISDPTDMVTVGISSGFTSGYTEGIHPIENYVFTTASTQGIASWSTYDIANPRFCSQIEVLGEVNCLKVVGNYMYIGPRNGGIWVIDISDPANPSLVNYVEEIWGRYYSIAHQGDYLYILGAWGGLNILDISEPTDPQVVIEDWGPNGFGSYGAMYVEGDYAYYNAGGTPAYGALRIVNISDPFNPHLVAQTDTTVYYIAKYEDNYLVVTSRSGLHIFDISDTINPVVVGTYPGDRYLCPVAIKGDIAFAGVSQHFQSIDISDVTNPQLLWEGPYGYSPRDISIKGNYAYCTSSDLRVYDISDPTNLVLIDTISNLPARAGDGEIQGDYWYVSVGACGVIILSIVEGTGLPKERLQSERYLEVFYTPSQRKIGVQYYISQESQVSLRIYNIAGQIVKTLVDGISSQGIHCVYWDGTDDLGRRVANGVYLCKLQVGNYSQTKKLLLLK